MRIMVLSSPGREDLVRAHMLIHRAEWPSCRHPMSVIDGPTEGGWTRRFLAALSRETDPFIYLTIDDFLYVQPVNDAVIDACLAHMEATPSLGLVQLIRAIGIPERPYPALDGFRKYDGAEPLYKRSALQPSIVRRDFYIRVAENVLSRITPRQDAGWVGAYNFELGAGAPSLSMDVVSTIYPPGDARAPVGVLNAVLQDGWVPAGLDLCRRHGMEPDMSSRGCYVPGRDPYMDKWHAARSQ
jgi:hypothetical protein